MDQVKRNDTVGGTGRGVREIFLAGRASGQGREADNGIDDNPAQEGIQRP